MQNTALPIQEYIQFAHTLADLSGGIIQHYFRARIGVECKDDSSPVTQADQEVEAALRQQIATHYPQHGFLGEESGSMRAGSEYCWVIDPIDGTKNFMTGQPTFGTLIALLRGGVPVLGLIDQPITRERWIGAQGEGATLNGAAIHADRSGKTLRESMLSTTSPYLFSEEKKAAFERVRQRVRYTVFGSDCYAYAMVATGFLDLVVESGLKAHDVMALIPVIEGAGGVITDWQGRKVTLHSGEVDVIAASSLSLHREALAILHS